MLNIQDIQEYHKHRFPYLLIDHIDELEPGKSVRGHKNFTENEWLFHCYKDDSTPIPFTMQIEILTEMFLMPILALDECKGKITNFLGADSAESFRDIYPGDRLDIEAKVESWRRGVASGRAMGYINGVLVCSAKLRFVIPDIMNQYKPRNMQ